MSSVLLQNFPLNLGRNYPLIPLLILFFLEQIPLLILTNTFSPHPLGILSSFPNFPPNLGEIRHFYRPSVVPTPATSYRSSPTGTCLRTLLVQGGAAALRRASSARLPSRTSCSSLSHHLATPQWRDLPRQRVGRQAAGEWPSCGGHRHYSRCETLPSFAI